MGKFKNQTFFRESLLTWSKSLDRPMPWKGEKNPYLIWLSEVILQQTRVEQGWAYFVKFKENFPTIQDLANAPEDQVMKLWEGLGYYSRARNLHKAAKLVANEMNGVFPDNYQSLLELPGVGTYTAAAIASFAYNLPHAVVDGNVYRVLARYFGIKDAIDSTAAKKLFFKLANELIDKEIPSKYNQAIMDFGAVQCKPKIPICDTCPLNSKCIALKSDLISELPFKSKKIKKRTRYFYYFILNNNGKTLIKKRVGKDIWQNLYDFPLMESESDVTMDVLEQSTLWRQLFDGNKIENMQVSKPIKHILTHQKIIVRFLEFETALIPDLNDSHQRITDKKSLKNYAFPKVIDLYLQDNSLYLKLI